jgi:hypothetical protein
MDRKIVYVDMDNVLVDFKSGIEQFMRGTGNYNLSPKSSEYFREHWKITN